MLLVTGVTVLYNTPEIFLEAIRSVIQFYPGMSIIVINNSTDGRKYKCPEQVQFIEVNENIGHGRGLHKGMLHSPTRHTLIFDSDIVLQKKGLVEKMLDAMREDRRLLACGEMQYVDKNGRNVKPGQIGTPYIHPYFALYDTMGYFAYSRFIHHGAPSIRQMHYLHERGLSETALREFNVKEYVRHEYKGTRSKYPTEFLKGWETTS